MIVTDLTMINQDYTLIIDRSGSMLIKDGQELSRWERVKESSIALAHKCDELDDDGITVYIFSGRFTRYDNVDATKMEQIFEENEPGGNTNMSAVLKDAIENYLKRKEAGETKDGETIVVITDGEPSEGHMPTMRLIAETTEKLDSGEELNISFLQEGEDEKATKFLKALDDRLTEVGAIYDIVDTKKISDLDDMSLTDFLLAAIND